MRFSNIDLQPGLPPLFPEGGGLQAIYPINAQLVGLANQRSDFNQALKTGHCVVDGLILLWGVNLRAQRLVLPRFEKLSGSDLVYRIAGQLASKGRRLLLIGATETANAESVAILRERFQLDVHGYSPPFAAYPMPKEWIADLLKVIKEQRPYAIFVAFGAPKQELLIADLKSELEASGVGIVMAVGGSLDFVSGQISRAPKWVQSAGLEGLYRLIQQPNMMRVRRILESLAALRYFLK